MGGSGTRAVAVNGERWWLACGTLGTVLVARTRLQAHLALPDVPAARILRQRVRCRGGGRKRPAALSLGRADVGHDMEIWKYGNNGCQRGRVDLKRLRKVSHWDGLASGLEKREDADEDMGVEEGNGDKNGSAARRRACWCAWRER